MQFAIALTLIVVLEIAAAVAGAVYYSSVTSTLEDQYTESWQSAIADYRVNPEDPNYLGDINSAVDGLQTTVSLVAPSRLAKPFCGDPIYELRMRVVFLALLN